jgi:hypothetical protein
MDDSADEAVPEADAAQAARLSRMYWQEVRGAGTRSVSLTHSIGSYLSRRLGQAPHNSRCRGSNSSSLMVRTRL